MHQSRTISIPSCWRRNMCWMSAKSNVISKISYPLTPNTSGWCRAYMILSTSLHASDEDMPMVTQVTHKHVHEGPIKRSRAKRLQQEVNTLLCEIHFNINENYILPKSCTLLLLRFTKEDDINTKEDYREGPHSNLTSAPEQSERISHNFLFPKAIMVNEDILEILSSLLSNEIYAEYFWLSSNEI